MEIKELIKDIDGWLTNDEATTLYMLAKNNPFNGVIVEIGSWKGKSTVCLAKGSQSGLRNKIFAIDPHIAPAEKLKKYLDEDEISTFEKFKDNIEKAKVDNIIIPIVDFSTNAILKIDEAIDLIFIDGSHEYEDVLGDFNLFFPKVREGGVIAFHDTQGGGPYRVVIDNLFLSKGFKKVRFVDTITYAIKVNKNTFLNRLENRYTLVIFYIYNHFKRKSMPKIVNTIGKSVFKLIKR